MTDQKPRTCIIAALREMARRKMPQGLSEFLNRGIGDEVSQRVA